MWHNPGRWQSKGVRGVLILSAVLMSACSSVQNIASRQVDDAALIQTVLVRDASLRLISSECMRRYPQLMPEAYETEATWWQRNGRWVVKADQSLNKVVLDSVERTENPVETTLGLSVSLQTFLSARENRERQVNDATDRDDCRELLAEYREGEHDFAADESLAEELPRLQQLAEEYYPPTGLNTEEMLQSPDRSRFIAERLAQEALCEQAQLTPLVRQWPREVYNVSCGANRQALIRCEWSECRILP